MQRHRKISDRAFEINFKEGSFPAKDFTHEAHLRLAWIHIQQYGMAQAKEHIQTQLRHYVKCHKAESKYNHTVTIAAVLMVHSFMQQTDAETFLQFISEHPQLKSDFKGLLALHYSFDIFKSEKARNTYLEPDLLPFK